MMKTRFNETGSFIIQKTITLLVTFILTATGLTAQSAGKGIIAGKIVDHESGAALVGANVMLEGTTIGGATDLEGTYRIKNIAPGSYTLIFRYMGYATKHVTDVDVVPGQLNKLNISLSQEVLEGEAVAVTAKAVRNTETVLLRDRQKSSAVSDAISAEAISRAGAGDAASAMKQVTGASVVGGKEIYIRGLGDRYTSTQLNGAEIPSTDPYKRAGSIDLIPSNLIDNIVAVKSFTPDKVGNFSGGTVDIRTKDFPDYLTLKFSTSTGFNPNVTLKDNGFLSYSGGNRDFLGIDDGTRDMPEAITKLSAEELNALATAARQSHEDALIYHNTINSFTSKQMRPVAKIAPLDQSYSFSAGNQVSLFGRELGFLASLSYSQKYSAFTDGAKNNWYLGAADIDAVDELQYDYKYNEDNGKEEVLWGGLLKTSYKINANNFLSLDFVYNRNSESSSSLIEGESPYDDEGAIVYSSRISYNERELYSLQLSGKHNFTSLLNTKMEWSATQGSSYQNEPDIRYFTNGLFLADSSHYIKHNVKPRRFYRELDGDRNEYKFDISTPFQQWSGLQSTFKYGGFYAEKTKNFTERNFYYNKTRGNSIPFNGNVEDFMSNIGFVEDELNDESAKYYQMEVVMEESVPFIPWYEGTQKSQAAYAMIDMPLAKKLRFIGGARYESSDIDVALPDSTIEVGFKEEDVLPSLNLIYAIGENANLRISYGKTIALPSFREIVPFESYEFIGGIMYYGNPELKRTVIDNFDLRWEWFVSPGELMAVSAFYKDFHNPIETRYYAKEKEMSWVNVDEAWTGGLEFELRKRLHTLSPYLNHFMIGGNLALVYSRVIIPEFEMAYIRDVDPDADNERAFQGQSPYILNMNLTYENPEARMAASLYYNVFGERLAFSTGEATPDVYEKPFHSLNLSYSWGFMQHLGLSFKVSNLLDSSIKQAHEFKGEEYVFTEFKPGIHYSFGLNYSL